MSKISQLIAMMVASGISHYEATKQATFMGGNGSPIFIPKTHTKMSYAKQNRLARGGRNKSMYAK